MRRHYLDNIRWITVGLVVLYQVIFMYNGVVTAGVIGPFWEIQYQDAVQYLLYPWFMVLLFLVSGMCARYYLEGHTDREFLAGRTRKLLVPSTIGLFVFWWIQGYFNMAFSHVFDQSWEKVPKAVGYLIMVLSGVGILWYIQVLWVLSALLVLLRKIEKDRLYAFGEKAALPVLFLLVIPVWGAAQILNTPVICVYRFGIYGICFLLGYYVFSHEKVTDRLACVSVPLAAAAVVLAVFYVRYYFGENYAEEPVVNSPFSILYGWTVCLAVLGGMKRWGNRTSRKTAWLSKKSYGLYLFHYLALSAAAYFLDRYTKVTGVAAYLLSGIAAYAGGYLLYELIKRIPVIRWCVIGEKKERNDVPASRSLHRETGAGLIAEVFDVTLDELVNYEGGETRLPFPPKGKHAFGMVKVGEKGQIVIPAKARKIFDIKPGDVLMVLGDEEQGIALLKEQDFMAMVQAMRHMET